MKTAVLIVNVALGLALSRAATGARAQEKPEPEALPFVKPAFREAQDEVRVQLGKAKQQLAEVRDRVATVVRRSGDVPGQSLVVRHSSTDAKTQANLEEDLAVMSRILEKASVQDSDERRPHHAMGINLLFGPGPGSLRSLYLEDYGALFMVNVPFPLLPPPAKAEAQKSEPESNSTWEDVRRELYGQRGGRKMIAPPVQPYSEEQVKGLKDKLLEALKNGANIRNLKPDESITVCVFGGASAVRFKGVVKRATKAPEDAPDEDLQNEFMKIDRAEAAPARGTMLTIRVKKADVDALAKGEMNLEQFRNKAALTTTTYAGDAGAWSGDVSFGFGGGGFHGGGFGGTQ